MILFELKCAADHRFEAWFRNSDSYAAQAAEHAITCPVCGDADVTKAPMAPRISKGLGKRAPLREPVESAQPGQGNDKAVAVPVPAAVPAAAGPAVQSPADEARQRLAAEMMRQLGELRRKVEENCDYVGDRFAEEARRIHYGETDPHGIYGEASDQDVEELREEGVDIHRIPWLPRTS
ncbi:DUF1178 family protein [Azospirillum sp. SYSU D00513]|uniref:DUF1178 family protein n=1 Tax=Azospirillum sp. SYSU D00513 TaxID=2812561 RepID=UPI001A95C55E|nr:DUF1178 family protein [Azospirillum sp. SYSU D00513]